MSLIFLKYWKKKEILNVFSQGQQRASISYKKKPAQKQVSKTWWKSKWSYSVVSNSLWPHGLQYTRPPCPSPTPGVHPNPCPLCRWCHPTISSSVVPFSSCPQSFPASGSFQMSQLSTSGDQSIGVSASTSANEHPGLIFFRMDWLDLLVVQGTQESSPKPQFKSINSLVLSFLYSPTLKILHDYWKNHSLGLDGPLLDISNSK